MVHLAFSCVIFITVLVFNEVNDRSVITSVFVAAGYTYGPILGLFIFGIYSKQKVVDKWVPAVCVISPLISYTIKSYSPTLLNGYEIGFEILIVNGLLTVLGLWAIRSRSN